jgi:putative transposase
VKLTYSYRLEPTTEQAQALARAFGCARVVYNDAITLRRKAHEAGEPFIGDTECQRQVITEAKHTPQREWLAEASSVVLIQALADQHRAWRNFFASITGKRKGHKVGPPRYRSKKDRRQTIRLTRNGFTVRPDGRLYVAKVGDLGVVWTRPLPSEPSSVTVVKDAAGRYHARFVVEVAEQSTQPVRSEVGIDLGLTDLAVLSTGEKIANPRHVRKAECKLARAQRAFARTTKGSANRQRARTRVARLHAQVADRRNDYLHKKTTRITSENQAVYVEDLAVVGLARTRLSKSVYDAGWATFRFQTQYKQRLRGHYLGLHPRFERSTGVCPDTAARVTLSLADRWWDCACGARHDRDVAAAQTLLARGRRERLNACPPGNRRGDVRPSTIGRTSKQEVVA